VSLNDDRPTQVRPHVRHVRVVEIRAAAVHPASLRPRPPALVG